MRTMTARSEIDAIFTEGRRFSLALLSILIMPTPASRGPEGRVMFVAGKKIGNAVQRNRAKRVLRAAVQRTGGPWDGYDVALIARESTARSSVSAIDEALTSALVRAGLLG